MTEQPYPSLEGIGEDRAALCIVSPAYAGRAGELNAILQYVYQAVVLGETGHAEAGRELMRIAREEMHHLEVLATLICKLGAPPIYANCPLYPVGFYSAGAVDRSRELPRMLEIDLAGERMAVAQYGRMICSLQNERVSAVLQRILLDEEEHIRILKELIAAL